MPAAAAPSRATSWTRPASSMPRQTRRKRAGRVSRKAIARRISSVTSREPARDRAFARTSRRLVQAPRRPFAVATESSTRTPVISTSTRRRPSPTVAPAETRRFVRVIPIRTARATRSALLMTASIATAAPRAQGSARRRTDMRLVQPLPTVAATFRRRRARERHASTEERSSAATACSRALWTATPPPIVRMDKCAWNQPDAAARPARRFASFRSCRPTNHCAAVVYDRSKRSACCTLAAQPHSISNIDETIATKRIAMLRIQKTPFRLDSSGCAHLTAKRGTVPQ